MATDVIIEKGGEILLIKRGGKTFHDKLSFPGGHVEYSEKVEKSARREAKEETGLNVKIKDLVGVYSDPKRDPRGHVISVVFEGEIKSGELKASSDAKEAKFYKINEILKKKKRQSYYYIYCLI